MGKVQELQHLSLATTYEVDNSFDSEKFIKMRLRVQHDGINPNKSNFELSDIEKAKDSIKNIPILANIIVDENGEYQFGGHDMEITETEDGEYQLTYKETPIGVVPESCNYSIDKFNNKNYVFCDAYIWKGYSNRSQDIIERDNDIKLSMEILVDGYSYDAKQKVYNITDYRYTGITFLNKNYGTGMENALATTGTFSEEQNKDKFIIMMQELKDTLESYNIKQKEGGSKKVNEKQELIEKYGLTVESLDFSIEELSLEELENKLKEFTSNNDDANSSKDDNANSDNNSAENFEENNEENREPEKFIKSFELSHSDIRYALYQLLSPIEVEDNEWYFIDQVYNDRFEYMNWDGTKIYRQSYIQDGDNVSFEGERIELFQVRLTKEEKDALEQLKGNYSTLESEVNDLRSFKQTIETEQRNEAEKELYSQFPHLEDNEEFKKLKENASNFTLEQLEKEIAYIALKVDGKFSKKQEGNTTIKVGVNFSKKDNKSDSCYGDLFDKYGKSKKDDE